MGSICTLLSDASVSLHVPRARRPVPLPPNRVEYAPARDADARSALETQFGRFCVVTVDTRTMPRPPVPIRASLDAGPGSR